MSHPNLNVRWYGSIIFCGIIDAEDIREISKDLSSLFHATTSEMVHDLATGACEFFVEGSSSPKMPELIAEVAIKHSLSYRWQSISDPNDDAATLKIAVRDFELDLVGDFDCSEDGDLLSPAGSLQHLYDKWRESDDVPDLIIAPSNHAALALTTSSMLPRTAQAYLDRRAHRSTGTLPAQS